MIKELFVAIVLGAILGFSAMGGYFSLNRNRGDNPRLSPSPTIIGLDSTSSTAASIDDTASANTTPAATSPTPASEFYVEKPKNFDLVTTDTVSVQGVAPSGTLVTLANSSKTYTAESINGQFTFTNVKLEAGVNYFQLHAVTASNQSYSSDLTLTLSKTKL